MVCLEKICQQRLKKSQIDENHRSELETTQTFNPIPKQNLCSLPTATPAKHFTATSQHHNNHLVPLKPGWDPHPSLYPFLPSSQTQTLSIPTHLNTLPPSSSSPDPLQSQSHCETSTRSGTLPYQYLSQSLNYHLSTAQLPSTPNILVVSNPLQH